MSADRTIKVELGPDGLRVGGRETRSLIIDAIDQLPRPIRADAERLTTFATTETICHRVKPWVTLVWPAEFDRATTRGERMLASVLPMLARLTPRLRIRDVHSVAIDDSASIDALRTSLFNIVLGDKTAHRRVRAYNARTILLSSDPCSFNADKWRLYWPVAGETTTPVQPPATRGHSISVFVTPMDDIATLASTVAAFEPSSCKVLLNDADWPDDMLITQHFSGCPIERLKDLTGRFDPKTDIVVSEVGAFAHFLTSDARERLFITSGESTARVPADDYLYKGHDLNYLKVVNRALRLGLPSASASETVTVPLISILVPVYDRTIEIKRLCESILRQDYQNLEVIFISNGSPEPTLAMLRQCMGLLSGKRITVELLQFTEAFGSATIPRDIGIYQANGDFLCFIDSDDWFSEGFFDAMKGTCDLRTIYYPTKVFHNFGRKMPKSFPYHKKLTGLGAIERGRLVQVLKDKGNFFANSGIIAPRRFCEDVGGIWHKLRYAEDYYLWLALAKAGAAAHEHQGVVNIALHKNNNELTVGDDAWVRTAVDRADGGVLAV